MEEATKACTTSIVRPFATAGNGGNATTRKGSQHGHVTAPVADDADDDAAATLSGTQCSGSRN